MQELRDQARKRTRLMLLMKGHPGRDARDRTQTAPPQVPTPKKVLVGMLTDESEDESARVSPPLSPSRAATVPSPSHDAPDAHARRGSAA